MAEKPTWIEALKIERCGALEAAMSLDWLEQCERVRLKENIQVRFCLLDYYRKCTENLWAGLSQVQPWILIRKLVTVWIGTKETQKVFTKCRQVEVRYYIKTKEEKIIPKGDSFIRDSSIQRFIYHIAVVWLPELKRKHLSNNCKCQWLEKEGSDQGKEGSHSCVSD